MQLLVLRPFVSPSPLLLALIRFTVCAACLQRRPGSRPWRRNPGGPGRLLLRAHGPRRAIELVPSGRKYPPGRDPCPQAEAYSIPQCPCVKRKAGGRGETWTAGRRGRERALIYKTLVLTGLRKGELASLIVARLELAGPAPSIVLNPADEKNRQGSQVPLRPDLAADLRNAAEQGRRAPAHGSSRHAA